MEDTTREELYAFKEDVERAKLESSKNLPSWARDMKDEEYSEYFATLAGKDIKYKDFAVDTSDSTAQYRQSLIGEQAKEMSSSTAQRKNLLQRTSQEFEFSPLSTVSNRQSNDTSLYAVLIKKGEGSRILRHIMKKCTLNNGETSSFGRTGVTTMFLSSKDGNYLYIEAHSKRHLLSVLSGCQDVYTSQIASVPLSDRKKILDKCTSRYDANVGDFARFRSTGFYENDLCQIMQINGDKVLVKAVPRIDYAEKMETPKHRIQHENKSSFLPYTQNKPSLSAMSQEVDISKGIVASVDSPVPAKKLFSPSWVEGAEKVGDLWRWTTHTFTDDGFILKNVVMSQLSYGDKIGRISADEKDAFSIADRRQSQSTTTPPATDKLHRYHSFNCGDTVRIANTAYKGLTGVILQTDQTKLVVRVEGSRGVVHFDTEEVRPYYALDSAVTVVSGPYVGQTGIVVGQLPHADSIVLYLQQEGQEVQISQSDVEGCSRYIALEGAKKKAKANQRSVREGNLVDIIENKDTRFTGFNETSNEVVAFVVKVTNTYLLCLKPNNTLLQIDSKGVQRKSGQVMKSFRDRNDNIVHVGECVRISSKNQTAPNIRGNLAGLSKKRIATVKAVWDDFVFLQEVDSLHDNVSSMLAEKRHNLISVNSKKARKAPDATENNVNERSRASTVIHPGILYH